MELHLTAAAMPRVAGPGHRHQPMISRTAFDGANVALLVTACREAPRTAGGVSVERR